MYYVALLDAIHLGARWDSYHRVKVEDFNTTSKHWVVFNHGYFTNFAQRIKEKTDEDVTTYRIHFDDTVKERCLARHLLVFHHCSGVSSGYVFPNEKELREARAALLAGNVTGWHAEDAMDYEKLCQFIEHWRTLVKGAEHANWGPHSTRITKYLWGFLGGADLDMAAKAARHKCMKMAMQYLQDSASIRDLLKDHPQLRNLQKVPPFRDDIVLGNGENMERALLELPNRKVSCNSLQELCRIFVEDMLHVSPQHDKYRDPEFLLKLSYQKDFQLSHDGSDDPHTALIKAVVPQNKQYGLLQSLDQVRKSDREHVKRAIEEKEVALRAVDRMRRDILRGAPFQPRPDNDITSLRSELARLQTLLEEKDKALSEITAFHTTSPFNSRHGPSAAHESPKVAATPTPAAAAAADTENAVTPSPHAAATLGTPARRTIILGKEMDSSRTPTLVHDDTTPSRISGTSIVPCTNLLSSTRDGMTVNFSLEQHQKNKITKASGPEKASLLLELIDEITEIGSAHDRSTLQAYAAGKSKLSKELNRKEQIAHNSFIKRNLTPIHNHYVVCCKNNRDKFMDSLPEPFVPEKFVLHRSCPACDKATFKAIQEAKCNAGKTHQTLQDFLDNLTKQREHIRESKK